MEMGNLPPYLDPEAQPEAPVEVDLDDAAGEVPSGLVELEDGSVEVLDLDDAAVPPDTGFDANLAEHLDAAYLRGLGTKLLDLVEADIRAREPRDKQYAEGIKRTGVGEKAPGGAEFDGASSVTHPMLTKGCVDFASRAIKELFPADGPCKTKVIGEQTEAKLDKAERKRQFMNWQLTTQIVEQRPELEKVLSQIPLAGVQYKRWRWDHDEGRARTEAFYVDDVFLAIGASNYYTADRATFRERISRRKFERRVATGTYREVSVADDLFSADEVSRSATASDKVEGLDPSADYYNEEGLRTVYQIEVMLDLEGQDPSADRAAPYIVHLDHGSGQVLGLYRNWLERDEHLRKVLWASEWPFIPWRGGQAIGLTHIIGSMAGAATGTLRALLDAGHIQNFPAGLMLDGGKTPGESVQVSATQLQKISAPTGSTDPDIRKLVMGFPFPGPSQVLVSLLEWLTQYAEGVVQTASDKLAEGGANMPVGTAMALIEHGAANFSAIHARLHYAQAQDLMILHRLNSEYLEDEQVIEELGERIVRREDFEGPVDIAPVSDPNIFSEAQRLAQLQAVLQLKQDPGFAPFFKPEALLRRALKLLQVNDPDAIANLPGEAKRLPPLQENYVVASSDDSAPLKVYEEQDDLAHLKAHVQFATSPMLGANPLIAPRVLAPLLEHCKEHLLQLYRKHTNAAVEAFRAVMQVHRPQAQPSEEELQLQAAAFTDQVLAELLGPVVMPALQAMQQQVGQLAQASGPKPTPDVQLAQQTLKEIETMRVQADLQKAQLKAQDGEADRRNDQALAQLATNVQLMQEQQRQSAVQLRAEFQAQTQKQLRLLDVVIPTLAGSEQAPSPLAQLLVPQLLAGLEQALQRTVAGAAGQGSEVAQMLQNLMAQQDNLAKILEASQQLNQQTFQQLGAAIQQLAGPQA